MYESTADEFQQFYYKRIIHADYLATFEDAQQQLWNKNFVEVEYFVTHLDGTRHWIHQYMYVSQNKYDSSRIVSVISRDISKSKLVDEQIIQLRLQQERVEILQKMVSDISIDFHTPVSIMNTSIDQLSQSTSGDTQDDPLQTLKMQVHVLEKLIASYDKVVATT